jgi:hypothetical protein
VVDFLSPNQDVDVARIVQGTFWLTNPETGATVQNRAAGRYTEALVSGDPAGIHTIESTAPGLNEQLLLQNGRVLSRTPATSPGGTRSTATSGSSEGSWSTRGRTRTPTATSPSSAR